MRIILKMWRIFITPTKAKLQSKRNYWLYWHLSLSLVFRSVSSSDYFEAKSPVCAEQGGRLTEAGERPRWREWAWRGERAWHCRHCSDPLTGLSFSWRQDQPYCLDCLTALFSKSCQGCPQPIRNHQWRVSFHWQVVFRVWWGKVHLPGWSTLAHRLLPLLCLFHQLGGHGIYLWGERYLLPRLCSKLLQLANFIFVIFCYYINFS